MCLFKVTSPRPLRPRGLGPPYGSMCSALVPRDVSPVRPPRAFPFYVIVISVSACVVVPLPASSPSFILCFGSAPTGPEGTGGSSSPDRNPSTRSETSRGPHPPPPTRPPHAPPRPLLASVCLRDLPPDVHGEEEPLLSGQQDSLVQESVQVDESQHDHRVSGQGHRQDCPEPE